MSSFIRVSVSRASVKLLMVEDWDAKEKKIVTKITPCIVASEFTQFAKKGRRSFYIFVLHKSQEEYVRKYTDKLGSEDKKKEFVTIYGSKSRCVLASSDELGMNLDDVVSGAYGFIGVE